MDFRFRLCVCVCCVDEKLLTHGPKRLTKDVQSRNRIKTVKTGDAHCELFG